LKDNLHYESNKTNVFIHGVASGDWGIVFGSGVWAGAFDWESGSGGNLSGYHFLFGTGATSLIL